MGSAQMCSANSKALMAVDVTFGRYAALTYSLTGCLHHTPEGLLQETPAGTFLTSVVKGVDASSEVTVKLKVTVSEPLQ